MAKQTVLVHKLVGSGFGVCGADVKTEYHATNVRHLDMIVSSWEGVQHMSVVACIKCWTHVNTSIKQPDQSNIRMEENTVSNVADRAKRSLNVLQGAVGAMESEVKSLQKDNERLANKIVAVVNKNIELKNQSQTQTTLEEVTTQLKDQIKENERLKNQLVKVVNENIELKDQSHPHTKLMEVTLQLESQIEENERLRQLLNTNKARVRRSVVEDVAYVQREMSVLALSLPSRHRNKAREVGHNIVKMVIGL